MKQALIYSLKVWLTSVVLGSLISTIPMTLRSESKQQFAQALGFIPLLIAIVAALSFCSWLLLFLFTYLFTKQSFRVKNVKLILSFLGLVLSVAPLLLLADGGLGLVYTIDLITYPAWIIAGLWFYKLQSTYEEDTAQV